MPIFPYDLTVIIPAYLEGENLIQLLPRLNITVAALSINYEIIVVDTVNSMDNTQEVCILNKVKCINTLNKDCYGNAIRTGIKNANGAKIIFMDGDGSHEPEFIKELWQYKDSYDLVAASRYIPGGNRDSSRLSIFLSKLLNVMYASFLKINCKDLSNSFKLYDTKQLKELVLVCNHFDIIEEMIFKLAKNKTFFKIKEIPSSFKKRMHGETKKNFLVFVVSYFITIIKLKLNK
jgi:dolichol-phosphate mannosyltransferase